MIDRLFSSYAPYKDTKMPDLQSWRLYNANILYH